MAIDGPCARCHRYNHDLEWGNDTYYCIKCFTILYPQTFSEVILSKAELASPWVKLGIWLKRHIKW